MTTASTLIGSSFHFHHTRLQHQPLPQQRARLLAPRRQLLPRVGGDCRADPQRQPLSARLRFREQAMDEPLELSPPLVLRVGPNVTSLDLNEIVGDEGDRQLTQRLFADDLSAEPLLQAREQGEAVE
jgi:hypothetical protein